MLMAQGLRHPSTIRVGLRVYAQGTMAIVVSLCGGRALSSSSDYVTRVAVVSAAISSIRTRLFFAVVLQADVANNALRRVDLFRGIVTTLAGSPSQSWGQADGTGSAVLFRQPYDVAVDASGATAIVVS